MGVVIKTKNLKGLLEMGAMPHQCSVLTEWGTEWHKGPTITLQIGTYVYKSTTIHPGAAAVQSFLAKVISDHVDATEPGHAPKTPMIPSEPLSSGPIDNVIPLRTAKAMYQRVIGTSNQSVYVVVAIASKADVKVAAKVNNHALSVRVEGDGLSKANVVAKFTEQGLSLKKQTEFMYMSGHYSCDEDAPPDKVLGAILMGSGVHFDTVIPLMSKVVEGSS